MTARRAINSPSSFRDASAASGPGIHTPQRWAYGFRVRGRSLRPDGAKAPIRVAALRNDELMIRYWYDRASRADQRACRFGFCKASRTVCGRRPPITWAMHF
jgi:hypothetical protein